MINFNLTKKSHPISKNFVWASPIVNKISEEAIENEVWFVANEYQTDEEQIEDEEQTENQIEARVSAFLDNSNSSIYKLLMFRTIYKI